MRVVVTHLVVNLLSFEPNSTVMTYNFKLHLLIATLSGFLLFSCGDDDDDVEDPIVGSWKSTTFSLTDCDDGAPDLLDFACGGCIESQYNSDGTFTSRILIPAVLDLTTEGTYSTNGNTLTSCNVSTSICEDDSFTIVGDVLTISGRLEGCNVIFKLERG